MDNLKITGLTEQEINLIAAGLGELKFKDSWPLIMKIQDQVDAQLEELSPKIVPNTPEPKEGDKNEE